LIETIGCDVNVQDNRQGTPLHSALRNFNPNNGGNITTLTYLLNHKDVNVDIKDQYASTILHAACDNINTLSFDIFRILIETIGSDVNAQDNDNNTPIHIALNRFDPGDGGDIDVLIYLLGQKKVNVNIKGEYGDTLLHMACQNINILSLKIFKLLIETMGCDVNARDNKKDTPIHFALDYFNPNQGGDVTVWAYLINQHNVNIHAKHNNGRNLLHYACIRNYSSRRSVEVNAEFDTILCQIVEVIVERCVQLVLDQLTF
jgi:ankyrin repeat protein